MYVSLLDVQLYGFYFLIWLTFSLVLVLLNMYELQRHHKQIDLLHKLHKIEMNFEIYFKYFLYLLIFEDFTPIDLIILACYLLIAPIYLSLI